MADGPPTVDDSALLPGRIGGIPTGKLSLGLPARGPEPRELRLIVTPPAPAPTCRAVSFAPRSTLAPSPPGVTPKLGSPGRAGGLTGESSSGPADAAVPGNASRDASDAIPIATGRGKMTIRSSYSSIESDGNAVPPEVDEYRTGHPRKIL
jgi:hypothetical protein